MIHRATVVDVGERRLDVLTVRIYERPGAAPIVPRWLAAARAHLPEAVPVRFGDTEPLRGRFDRVGERGLLEAYASAHPFLFLIGSPPVHSASLASWRRPGGSPASARGSGRSQASSALSGRSGRSGGSSASFRGLRASVASLRGSGRSPASARGSGASRVSPRGPRWGPTVCHGLEVETGPDDERVRRFALELAGPATVYLSASISGGLLLDGRTLVGPATDPPEPYLAALGDFLGLPPSPPEWCWFGPDYVPLLRRKVRAEPAGGGLFYSGGPWIPERLRARLDEVDPVRRHARRMPRGLRRSAFRQMLDAIAR